MTSHGVMTSLGAEFSLIKMSRHIPITRVDLLLPYNLQSTMFWVKYFDQQIYDFLKLSVYSLYGLDV